MRLSFLFVGGHKEVWLQELSREYLRKLGYFCEIEITRLKSGQQPRASFNQKRQKECESLLKSVRKDDFLIVCDERGQEVSSTKFSEKLVRAFESGRARVVIVVGGAFGVNDEIRARADWMWSLSPLVFNHPIAQAVVLEQTYRAFTIWKTIPYHNE